MTGIIDGAHFDIKDGYLSVLLLPNQASFILEMIQRLIRGISGRLDGPLSSLDFADMERLSRMGVEISSYNRITMLDMNDVRLIYRAPIEERNNFLFKIMNLTASHLKDLSSSPEDVILLGHYHTRCMIDIMQD